MGPNPFFHATDPPEGDLCPPSFHIVSEGAIRLEAAESRRPGADDVWMLDEMGVGRPRVGSCTERSQTVMAAQIALLCAITRRPSTSADRHLGVRFGTTR